MKKIKLNLIILIALVPLLTFCGGVRDALEGKKRSEQSDAVSYTHLTLPTTSPV